MAELFGIDDGMGDGNGGTAPASPEEAEVQQALLRVGLPIPLDWVQRIRPEAQLLVRMVPATARAERLEAALLSLALSHAVDDLADGPCGERVGEDLLQQPAEDLFDPRAAQRVFCRALSRVIERAQAEAIAAVVADKAADPPRVFSGLNRICLGLAWHHPTMTGPLDAAHLRAVQAMLRHQQVRASLNGRLEALVASLSMEPLRPLLRSASLIGFETYAGWFFPTHDSVAALLFDLFMGPMMYYTGLGRPSNRRRQALPIDREGEAVMLACAALFHECANEVSGAWLRSASGMVDALAADPLAPAHVRAVSIKAYAIAQQGLAPGERTNGADARLDRPTDQ